MDDCVRSIEACQEIGGWLVNVGRDEPNPVEPRKAAGFGFIPGNGNHRMPALQQMRNDVAADETRGAR